MNKGFIEQQKKLALEHFKSYGKSDSKGKKAVLVVLEYLSSLLNTEDYTENQREDLRKLALEFGYKEDTIFDKWILNIPFQENINSE